MHNTSHVDDEPYPKLLQEKGFGGFPSLCFMDADGNVLIKQGARTVDAFEKTLGQLGERQALAKKAAAGDAKAEKELFLVDLGLGTLTAEQIKAGAKKLSLSKDEQKLVDQSLTDVEVAAIFAQVSGRKLTADQAGEQIAAMVKAGRTPTEAQASRFWTSALQFAAKQKDAKLAEQAFGELDKRFSKDQRYARAIPQWQKLLEQAKEK